MQQHKMTPVERRAVISLSSIMALRMIGLFMVIPVFSLYASSLKGATGSLIGMAIGIYGLSQAICQIPFGALSDRYGRKSIITLGLSIFILGSLIAGMAENITLLIIGRALQGVGAVGSTILAAIADLTREEQRAKSMAIAGITIGFSFSLSMLLGPILSQWLPIHALFFVAASCGALGILILYTKTPTPKKISWHEEAEPEIKGFMHLLKDKELAKLNIGIFLLHAIFTASFVVIPIDLLQHANFAANRQWLIYLPTLLIAFCFTLSLISASERTQQIKLFFLSGILMLAASELTIWQAHGDAWEVSIGLALFFTGFSLLEAFLPSLVSRTAPKARKGSALGIYSSAQFLGIFVGGALGGWLYGQYHFAAVYLLCVILALCWFVLALFMQPPKLVKTQ